MGSLKHGELLTVALLVKSPTKIYLYQKSFSTKWTYSLNVFSGIFYLGSSESTSEYHSFFKLNTIIFCCVIWVVTTWLKYNALPLQQYFKNYSVYLLLYNLDSCSLYVTHYKTQRSLWLNHCTSTSIRHCSYSNRHWNGIFQHFEIKLSFSGYFPTFSYLSWFKNIYLHMYLNFSWTG